MEDKITVDDKIFDIALKNNKLSNILKGVGAYKIYSNNMNLEAIVNTEPIMYKIYDYYLKNPNSQINIQFQNALETLSQYQDFLSIYTVMEFEDYQLSQEKNGKAPFKLNHLSILQILSNNLKLNRKIFEQSGMLNQYNLENGLMELIQKYDKKFNDEYGHKIL